MTDFIPSNKLPDDFIAINAERELERRERREAGIIDWVGKHFDSTPKPIFDHLEGRVAATSYLIGLAKKHGESLDFEEFDERKSIAEFLEWMRVDEREEKPI